MGSYAAAVLLGLLLASAPWIGRNIALGVPPFSTGGGNGAVALANNNTVDVTWESSNIVSSHLARIMIKTDGKTFPAIVEALQTHPSVWSVVGMIWNRFDAMWHWWERPDNVSSYFYELFAPMLGGLPVTFAVLSPLAIVGLVLAARRFPRHIALYLLVLRGWRRC